MAVLPVPAGRVTRLAFAADSRTLALATDSAAIMLWDVAEASPRATVAWPSGPALFLVFSPDGKTLAAGGEDAEVRLWGTSSGKLEATLHGHTDAIDWIAFSRDGRSLFTASRDTTLRVWNLPTMRPERTSGGSRDGTTGGTCTRRSSSRLCALIHSHPVDFETHGVLEPGRVAAAGAADRLVQKCALDDEQAVLAVGIFRLVPL